MKRLSYETLREQGYDGFLLQDAPERFLQFGEGNFLRAFADYFVDVMNEKCGFAFSGDCQEEQIGGKKLRELMYVYEENSRIVHLHQV